MLTRCSLPRSTWWRGLLGGLIVAGSLGGFAPLRSSADEGFDREIAPLLRKHCVECHGDDEPEAKLRLTSRDGLLLGSSSGPIVAPGQAQASMLLQLLAPGGKPHMPPEGQLTEAERNVIARWVDRLPSDALPRRDPRAGTDHWAYQPLSEPALPVVTATAWVRNPIDRFILARLEQAGLRPAPDADAATLCRRLHFDLIGLPPTDEELTAFETAWERGGPERDAAYDALVDKLLASPHYGERWGRHWLDLARYADSAGYHDDLDRPYAWRYRDYVIDSFNADRPYGEFIAQQLAGDELSPHDSAAWIATGFCRCGPTNDQNMGEGAAKEKYRLDLLDDVIATSSAVFLGQTIGCARCHDHKLDPITQVEYYRMLAVFDTSERVDVALDDAGAPLHVAPLRDKKKFEKDHEGLKWSIMGLTDAAGAPRATHLLWRGDVLNRGPIVEPGVPAVLAHEPFQLPATADGSSTTGRRKALADWIASPGNPLTWRVIANRIWQHHLGIGIVATPSNFGRSGAAPSHPELLDYLARQMLAEGGRWKPLHRLIVGSATYRQASVNPPRVGERPTAAIDPENRLLGRANQRRLEAEILRDSVLAVAGSLNPTLGGPGVKPRIRPELLVSSQRNKWPEVKQEGPSHWRRSVYIYIKRQLPFPLLELFDQPNPAQTCERRDENVVPTQALVLMNDEFITEQAGRFADRLLREAGQDPAAQVQRGVRLALGRRAGEDEVRETVAFLAAREGAYRSADGSSAQSARRNALVDFCHVLMNCNEFAYVD